jgi:hypothetical protein
MSKSNSNSSSGNSKGDKNLDRKPSLERTDALPALGTPNTLGDSSSTVIKTGSGKLGVNPGDQSSLLDKAKFAVDAVQGYVVDKIDNLSMNADDTEPMEGAAEGGKDSGALANAKAQLKEMKESVADKGQQLKGEAEKLASKDFIQKDDLSSGSKGNKGGDGGKAQKKQKEGGQKGGKDSSKDGNQQAVKNPVKHLNKEASKDISSNQA